jgi:hypothetical protein
MIQPTYGVLQTLFANRVFRIPHYQRFYSWHTRQRQELFSDLQKLANQEENCLGSAQSGGVGCSS